jgi:predicted ABC-type ATPase
VSRTVIVEVFMGKVESEKPYCWIIAGPNGAGKTTFSLKYLPQVAGKIDFINADMIAAGLSPLAPERSLNKASRIFLNRVQDRISRRMDFAFETTLSGRTYLKWIDQMWAEGWCVKLIYIALSNLAFSKQRVTERVAHGGHHIPTHDLERRFPRTLNNLLEVFSSRVNHCICFLNEGTEPIPVFSQTSEKRVILDQDIFDVLEREAQS